jgi:ABC-2 type transport system ATP-binding protein
MHGRLYGVPKDIRRKKSLDLLKLVDLEDRKDSLVKTFSGGMKRRLEIARGLLHEPKVLFLDEPTLGLDPQTRNKLWEYIRKLNEEKKITIILTTHYMDEADKLCNRIAIIDHGKIVTIDSSAKLKSSIGGQIMNIETKDKEKLVEALKSCKWCGEIKLHNGFVTVNVENAGKKIPDLVRLAEKNGIALGSISVSEPSLEDVFLHYTGRTIREQEATALDNLRKGRRMFGRR